MTMLVCFSKFENDDVRSGRELDRQYHVFTNCEDRISFVHDSIFRSFIDKGYTWSAVSFLEELVYKCGFTVSVCD